MVACSSKRRPRSILRYIASIRSPEGSRASFTARPWPSINWMRFRSGACAITTILRPPLRDPTTTVLHKCVSVEGFYRAALWRRSPTVHVDVSPIRTELSPRTVRSCRPGLQNSSDNVLITGAPAEIARQQFPNSLLVGVVGRVNALQRHQDSGGTEPTLNRAVLLERSLHVVQPDGWCDAFDGGDLCTIGLDGEHDAGPD